MKAILLANGQFPSHPVPLQVLKKAETVVCCDGAAQHLEKIKVKPMAIIGDLDSLPENLKSLYKNIVVHSPDQETNDLTKAVNWCHQKGYTKIDIIGATGKREDHTLGNISLLAEYNKMVQVKMVTDHGTFIPINKTTTFESKPGVNISVFSLNNQISIQSKNLKYPLDGINLHAWWCGTLNEVTANEFTLILNDHSEIIVYINHS